MLQFLGDSLNLFRQLGFNLTDTVTLRLQQLVGTLSLLIQRTGELLAPLVGGS
jgi:hypothetical protein